MIHLTPEELSARMDGALGGATQERVERHLAECSHCREALAALAAQEALLGPALEHDPGDSYFETFGARVEDRIRAAGLRGAQSRLGAAWLGWLRSPRRVAWAGAAAVVVVGAAVVLVTSRLEPPALKPQITSRLEQEESAPSAPALEAKKDAASLERDQLLDHRKTEDAGGQIAGQRRDESSSDATLGRASGSSAPLASQPSAPPAASTSRLIEVRRSASGEDVPVRANKLPATAPAADEKAEVRAQEGTRIVKPGAAQPMRDEIVSGQTNEGARAPAEAFSEAVSETRLCGRVLDPQGRPVSGAVVALAHLGRTATTDATGRFCLSAPAGTHDLTAMAVGYGWSRMQVRAEGETTDALMTLNPVSVLDRQGRSREGLTFSKDPEQAFTDIPESARALVRSADRLTLAARSADQLDAAAMAWQRAVEALPAGDAKTEALYKTAEVRTRAWRAGSSPRRAQAARAAVAAFLQVAPPGGRKEQAERWREQLR